MRLKEMLGVISQTWTGEIDPRLFRAPSNMLYKIKGFQVTNFSAVGNRIVVVRGNREESPVIDDDSDGIFSYDLAIDGSAHSIYFSDDGIETKAITIGFQNSASPCAVSMKIYYQLVKASTAALIWEFVKRGKNP